MKVLFIQGDYNFCYYVRSYLPGIYSNNIVMGDFIRNGTQIDAYKLMEHAKKADIISFQRPSGKNALELAKKLKEMGKYIIMDNDDTYSGIPFDRLDNERQVQIAKELNSNLNEFAQLAHGITTSTKTLANEYRKLNPNVAVLKNCIDPMDEFPCKKNDTGKFRIGFIGSVTSNDDYFHIKDQIKQLDEREDCTLVVMGVKTKGEKLLAETMREDFNFWNSLKNVEWHPLCNVTEYMYNVSRLALDLAIIPRKDHYFNECKSNLKYLEMSLLSIPVLAQAFPSGKSPYQQDSPYCTLVMDNNEWYNTIIFIKENYATYKNLSKQARDYVLKEYNIKNYAKTWQIELEKLCKSQKTF